MSDHTFERAYEFVQKWEGGKKMTMDPDDPGGATKYGISFRFIENLPLIDADINADGIVDWKDVASLDEVRARSLYRRYFWDSMELDQLNGTSVTFLAIVLFDTAVNCGRVRTVRWLQQALGLKDDGIMGPMTRGALMRVDSSAMVPEVLNRRMKHYHSLAGVGKRAPTVAGKYLAGWTARVIDLVCSLWWWAILNENKTVDRRVLHQAEKRNLRHQAELTRACVLLRKLSESGAAARKLLQDMGEDMPEGASGKLPVRAEGRQ